MTLLKWLPKESELNEGGMTIFRHQLLIFLIIISFIGTFFLIPWAVSTPPGPTAIETLSILFGIILAAITYLLRPNLPIFTSWVYVAGSLGWFTLLATNLPGGIGFSLLPVPVLLASLLLGPRSGFITGLAASFIVMWGHPITLGIDVTLFWLAAIIIVGGIGIITGDPLAQIDYWERSLVHEQRQSITQLQERQGELALVVKQLDQASERLARANTELTAARRLAEEARTLKEHFAANVSHELRTPLNIIVGFAEMMYLSPESYPDIQWSPDLQGDIQELYRASQHLQSLVNDVLDLSRINAVQLPMFRELQDIGGIIENAVKTVSPLMLQRSLTCEIAPLPDLPPLFIDRTRIRQVMINLLNNAVRYTDKGGIIVDVNLDEKYLIVNVRDTGIGIPEAQIEKIFDEFTQAEKGLNRRGGTGLGLALSRRFVGLHGGSMWVESDLGQGSAFHFSLPLPGTTTRSEIQPQTPRLQSADILDAPIVIVDPDPSMTDLFGRYLGERVALGARDLQQAITLVQNEHPQAVIVNLPPDTPDTEWLAQPEGILKQFGVPVFRCSIPSPSWLSHATGFDNSLTKPISREMLESIVTECAAPVSVLVVDDDPGFIRLLTRFLAEIDTVTEIHSAYDGNHALRLVREAKPDLVLLDILMPGMDGFQVLNALQNLPERDQMHIVAVTATAYGEEALLRRAAHLTLTQTTGLDTTAILQILNNALGWARPDYTVEDDNASSA